MCLTGHVLDGRLDSFDLDDEGRLGSFLRPVVRTPSSFPPASALNWIFVFLCFAFSSRALLPPCRRPPLWIELVLFNTRPRLKNTPFFSVKVWKCESVKVWKCESVKVWKCESVKVKVWNTRPRLKTFSSGSILGPKFDGFLSQLCHKLKRDQVDSILIFPVWNLIFRLALRFLVRERGEAQNLKTPTGVKLGLKYPAIILLCSSCDSFTWELSLILSPQHGRTEREKKDDRQLQVSRLMMQDETNLFYQLRNISWSQMFKRDSIPLGDLRFLSLFIYIFTIIIRVIDNLTCSLS